MRGGCLFSQSTHKGVGVSPPPLTHPPTGKGVVEMNIINHFITFAQLHPANAGALILVGLLILWVVGLVRRTR